MITMMKMTYSEAYKWAVNILEEARIVDAKIDARLLIEFICEIDRHILIAYPDKDMGEDKWSLYREAVHRRCTHYPLQYITGEQEFMGLRFKVNEDVLIPRQDSEFLVEEVLMKVHDGMKVLDVCTGSGCLIISVLKYKNNCSATAVDISEKALEVARENARNNGVEINFVLGDLLENIDGKYDVIISNPPYIRSDVIPTLMDEVRFHEPMIALDGYEDGLYFYRKIIDEVWKHLNIGGYMLFEIGHDQGRAVSELMQAAGYKDIEVKKDYAGNDRVVMGYLASY